MLNQIIFKKLCFYSRFKWTTVNNEYFSTAASYDPIVLMEPPIQNLKLKISGLINCSVALKDTYCTFLNNYVKTLRTLKLELSINT